MQQPDVQINPEVARPRGVPLWTGVVQIIRPDPTKVSHVPFADGPMCKVMSARTLALNGFRAIVTELPLKMVQHYFTSRDGDHVFVWAELIGEHLELLGKASIREWADYSGPTPANH